MANRQAKLNMIQKNESQHPALKDQEKQLQGIQKQQTLLETLNLQAINQSYNQHLSQSSHKLQAIPSSQASKTLKSRKRLQTLLRPSAPSRKRKRGQKIQKAENSSSKTQVNSLGSSPDCVIESTREANNVKLEGNTSIEHWRETGHWPKILFEPCPNMNQNSYNKRSFSVMSYTQSVKQGINPPAYTSEYEEILAEAGIVMHDRLINISNKCRKLCGTLLESEYEIPENSLFQNEFFWTTLDKVRLRNEARVFRDITPCIVPSAELLSTRGVLGLEHLTEEISAEWIKCIPLAGPRPKPDFAVGLSSSVFTDKEIQKLKYYKAPQKPTLFTENMFFPFFVCEVKCGVSALDMADRQNAHSTSMAINAILQLYQKEKKPQKSQIVSQAQQFHRKILIFSLSHDRAMVKIYGHYALIKKNKITFHRHLIRSFDLEDNEGKNKWIAYRFVRKVYDTFSLTHLERIQNGIALLPESKPESFLSIETKLELPGSREMLPSSQYISSSKKPRLTASSVLLQQLEAQKQEHSSQIRQMMQEANQREDRFREEANQREDRLREKFRQLIKQMQDSETKKPNQRNIGLGRSSPRRKQRASNGT